MSFTRMTAMVFHALESLLRNYALSSIFWCCFIMAKKKERTQFEKEGKALHTKRKMITRKKKEVLLSFELWWRKPSQGVKQSEWSPGPVLTLAKCQQKAMSKGQDVRLKRSLAWLQCTRGPETALLPFLFLKGIYDHI